MFSAVAFMRPSFRHAGVAADPPLGAANAENAFNKTLIIYGWGFGVLQIVRRQIRVFFTCRAFLRPERAIRADVMITDSNVSTAKECISL